MMTNVYRVSLTNRDLLAAIGAAAWHVDIAAHDMASAWRKFKTQRKAPAFRYAVDPEAMPDDYDIRLARNTRLEAPVTLANILANEVAA